MKRSLSILLLLCIAATRTYTQFTIGIPDITSYSNQRYNAGTQNWKIRQDVNGIVYFANNEGLLSFDGIYWKNYTLPNKTIVRSVEIGLDKKIYVGGQDEIGYFSPDKTGRLVYSSLKNLIPAAHRSFADIWDICRFEKDLFFRTNRKILQLSGDSIKVYEAPSEWIFMASVNHQLIAQDSHNGLLEFRNGSWAPFIKTGTLTPGFAVSAAIPFGQDSILVATIRSGLYFIQRGKLLPFSLIKSPSVTNESFSCCTKLDENRFALGTTNGCYIIDKKGLVIQHFNKSFGLSNSNVISIFSDRNRNIWLGLENGIDFIAYDNAITHVKPDNLNNGAGYSSAIFNRQLYLALSNGVYRLNLPEMTDLSMAKNEFKQVLNSQGQAWGLSAVNNDLLLGSHEGFFRIIGGTAIPVKKGVGFWTFEGLKTDNNENEIIAGNYDGIDIYENRGADLVMKQKVENFNESARFLAIDRENTIWTSHPYRGVYKISATGNNSPKVKLYTDSNGLPSALNNHIYKVKKRVVVATEKGIYEYDASRDQFFPSPYFQPIFSQLSIRYLKEDPNGNIWFIHNKDLGVVDFTNLKPELIYLPELKGKMVSGFEHINPLNENNIFIGGQEGFYHVNYEKYRKNDREISASIRLVQLTGKLDSTLFGGYFGDVDEATGQKDSQIPRLDHKWNSLHIEYASPSYDQPSISEYSYLLKGFDKGWSEWSKKTEKDYTNLPSGNYHFLLKARNNLGNESKISSYSFTVLAPWYQSYLAYFLYLLAFGSIAFLLYIRQQKRFRLQQHKHAEEQKQLQYLHQLELDKSEKEIITLKNEKLETQITHKNSELASTAMHLVQKGEILSKIKEELLKLNKNHENKVFSDNIRKIIRILNEEDKMNEDWEQFAGHFNKVHSDFLISLKQKYSNLNAHDLKICAYLRMNLSSKEIAQLMNISLRGVEISRYRLRKKLQIPTEINLFNFLLNFHSQEVKAGAN